MTTRPTVTAVIPALDEERTIGGVLSVCIGHPLIAETIVVSDGSRDRTADIAREAGATVIAFPENRGKGAAMDAGVRAAKNGIVLFLDADVIGLTEDDLSRTVTPVIDGEKDMMILALASPFDVVNYWHPLAISGERCLRTIVWERVPPHDRRGFEIEISMNYHARRAGDRIGVVRTHTANHVFKARKYGWRRGILADIRSVRTCLKVALRYYAVQPIFSLFSARRS